MEILISCPLGPIVAPSATSCFPHLLVFLCVCVRSRGPFFFCVAVHNLVYLIYSTYTVIRNQGKATETTIGGEWMLSRDLLLSSQQLDTPQYTEITECPYASPFALESRTTTPSDLIHHWVTVNARQPIALSLSFSFFQLASIYIDDHFCPSQCQQSRLLIFLFLSSFFFV